MSGSVNKVLLLGNVGKDPEIRSAPDGTRIASFSIATSEHWKDHVTGERKERTSWHNIVIFDDIRGQIVLLDSQGSKGPPPAGSADDYGSSTTRGAPGAAPVDDYNDDISF